MQFSALRFVLLVAPVLLACVDAASLIAGDAPITHYAKGSPHFTRLSHEKRSFAEPYEFKLHLKPPRIEDLEAKATQISLSNGEWLTDEQLGEYISPHPHARAELEQWLEGKGLTDYQFSKLGDLVTVFGAQNEVEELFQAQLHPYDVAGKRQVLRSDSYTIPTEISGLVEYISPFVSFIHPKSRAQPHRPVDPRVADSVLAKNGSEVCNENLITPQCLRKLYGIGNAHYQPKKGYTDLAILGYDDEALSLSDVDLFINKFNPQYKGWRPKLTYAGSATNDGPPGGETALDISMVASLIPPLNAEFFLTAGLQGDEILESLQLLFERKPEQRPGVLTCSYGPDEFDVTPAEARQYQIAALKLISVGTGVYFASGDWGLNGVQEGEPGVQCTDPIRTNPPFPTTPAIFLVGSTSGVKNEHTTLLSDSGGGFWSGCGYSGLYHVPDYQKEAHARYTATLPQWERQYFNLSGRIISDGSAYGEALPNYIEGQLYTSGGTSGSSPIFTSHIALVNAARRQKGLPNTGFVHPLYYRDAYTTGALRDITRGTACGCPSPASGVCLAADRGFDPPSGLGVPNFPGLLKLFNAE